MRRGMIGAILAWSGVLAGAVLAQPPGPPTADWTVQDLLDNPAAKAVLDRDLPGAEDDPRLALVRSMTLRTVAQFPEAGIDTVKLAKIEADLAAIGRR